MGYAIGSRQPTYSQVLGQNRTHGSGARGVEPPRSGLQRPIEAVLGVHDPTQGDRQGNDTGSQYRSAIYTHPEHLQQALASRDACQAALSVRGYGAITTEILADQTFYFAEDYHSNTSPNRAAAHTAPLPADAAWRVRRLELQTPEAGLGQVRLVHQSLRASIKQRPDSAQRLNREIRGFKHKVTRDRARATIKSVDFLGFLFIAMKSTSD